MTSREIRISRAEIDNSIAPLGGADGIVSTLETVAGMVAMTTGVSSGGTIGAIAPFITAFLKSNGPAKLEYTSDDAHITIIVE